MQSWWNWIAAEELATPWLILGKGPTFDRWREYDRGGYRTLGLNHVVREMPVDVAHVIDLEVIDDCPAHCWLAGCRVLVMPWHPHVDFHRSAASLAEIVPHHAVLSTLNEQGRLLWYDLQATSRRRDAKHSFQVPVRYFSAEAALRLLAKAGVGRVRSLGLDGGRDYATAFCDLQPLRNGQPSFEKQQRELLQITEDYRLDFAPLS